MKHRISHALGVVLLAHACLGQAAEGGTIQFQGHIADPATAEGAALLRQQGVRDQQARVAQGLAPPRDSDAALDALARAGQRRGEGDIDAHGYAWPVRNGSTTYDGYPQFLLRCDLQAGDCRNTQGQVVGTLAAVAEKLPPVRNRDALRRDWQCDHVCVDATGTVVGAMQVELRSWLEQHPQARLR